MHRLWRQGIRVQINVQAARLTQRPWLRTDRPPTVNYLAMGVSPAMPLALTKDDMFGGLSRRQITTESISGAMVRGHYNIGAGNVPVGLGPQPLLFAW